MTGCEEKDVVVEIVEGKLDVLKYIDEVRRPWAGAIATFGGTTRDTFQGKQVLELRYEAYIPMAVAELKRICREARDKWGLSGICAAHRIGIVPVGEESVFIAASSVHRRESLEACQHVIDQVKASVPIWKKEIYSDGEAWKENAEFQNLTTGCCSCNRK